MHTDTQPAPTAPLASTVFLGRGRVRALRSEGGVTVTVWADGPKRCAIVSQAPSGAVVLAWTADRSMDTYVADRLALGDVEITPAEGQPNG